MVRTISILKLWSFSLICFFSLSCATFNRYQGAAKESGRVKEFYSGRGNATVSPPYQNWRSIRGIIKEDKIAVHFTKVENGKMIEKDFELIGEDYQKCLKMIENTNVSEKEQANGADLPAVELTDSTDLTKSGDPRNKKEWDEFFDKIAARAMQMK